VLRTAVGSVPLSSWGYNLTPQVVLPEVTKGFLLPELYFLKS